MRRKGFTLVELLTVIAILGILYAIFMPVVRAAKGAAFQYSATQTIRQLGTAMNMYCADNEDTCPLALYPCDEGLQTWFGIRHDDGTVDRQNGVLSSYIGGKLGNDPTHRARPWFGDGTGFGYNWGHIGSDAHERTVPGDNSRCENAARISELSDPTHTIGFATSAYFFPKWLPHGDDLVYDCGFIFQNKFWHGNPPIDFRHMGGRVIDKKLRQVHSEGNALVLFMDGSVKAKKEKQITDDNFVRYPTPK